MGSKNPINSIVIERRSELVKNPYKLTYHIEPSKGLLNDPNGLIQYKGIYYFFHQWNRFSMNHDYKEWGLFTSEDMVNWNSHGSAIIPDRDKDRNGIYSGSSIEYDNNLYLFYTGSVKNDGVRKSYQCVSISQDGKTFIKQDIFIETPQRFTEHHRDPKVWKGKKNWWMIVGAQSKDEKGEIALYSSDDLLHWKYENVLYNKELDNMCECPDLFSVNDNIDILLCSPQIRATKENNSAELSSYSAFIAGKFNENSREFLPQTNLELIDYGFDFYAPQSFIDEKGRRIIVAWMSRMSEKEEELCPTKKYGYIHCLTLPRVITWQDGMLIQKPIEEVKKLRKNRKNFNSFKDKFELKTGKFEIKLLRNNGLSDFKLSLRNNSIEINYCKKTRMFSVSRKNWVTNKKESKMKKLNSLMQLNIFSDNSTLEVFVNNGESVFSLRYFTDENDLGVEYLGLYEGEKLTYFEL
ncbi:MAG: glycoside hydrolase family 32 protein [Clostridium butyricum]|nr:glycoside hydrolase family 32 protein [Clostridium butyricum]